MFYQSELEFHSNISELVTLLGTSSPQYGSIDTETTGLYPFLGDRPFAFIFGVMEGQDAKTFFMDVRDEHGQIHQGRLREVLNVCNDFLFRVTTVFMFNAKFDLHMLDKSFCDLSMWAAANHVYLRTVIDVMLLEKLIHNNQDKYSLAAVAERYGFQKDDTVDKFIEQNRLFKRDLLGDRAPDYTRIPYDMMLHYGKTDARVTLLCGIKAIEWLLKEKQDEIIAREVAAQRNAFAMESRGIAVDYSYIQKTILSIAGLIEAKRLEFETTYGVPLVSSGKNLALFLLSQGAELPLTNKGNYRTDEETLQENAHIPSVKLVLSVRNLEKTLSVFETLSKYAVYVEEHDCYVVHCNIHTFQAKTGRMSVTAPALQTIPKGEGEFSVRRAFIPRPGKTFVMIDYAAMEYRFLIDQSGERKIAEQIIAGLDIHQSIADMAGVTRNVAKSAVFAIIYGSGIKTLSRTLGVSELQAADIKRRLLNAMPLAKKYFYDNIDETKRCRGGIPMRTWTGRRFYLPPEEGFKATNYKIQGGCADIVKNFLCTFQWEALLPIHDEIIFEVASTKFEDIEDFAKKKCAEMAQAYKHRLVPMKCEASYSFSSWADKQKI